MVGSCKKTPLFLEQGVPGFTLQMCRSINRHVEYMIRVRIVEEDGAVAVHKSIDEVDTDDKDVGDFSMFGSLCGRGWSIRWEGLVCDALEARR